MWNRTVAVVFALLAASGNVFAADEEGCLLCHGLPLRRHAAEAPLFTVADQAGGLHQALICSDCHFDARVAPHAEPPGPASCLGDCHGGTAADAAAHRRASFGGLTELHRKISMPRAPCALCHEASDRRGDRPAAARCGSCHLRQRESVLFGIHGLVPKAQGAGFCPSCHPAHRVQEKEAGAPSPSCGGEGCHAAVTERMRRLAAHGGEARGGPPPLAAGLLFVTLASGGWFLGRALGAGGPRGNG